MSWATDIDRLARVQALMADRGLDALVVRAPDNLVYLTDWRGDADEQLTPTGPTVGELLESAARRGVTVRALLWRSHSDRASFSAQENQHLGRCINDAGGVALLDQRVRRGGSHHQKIVVVQHASRPGDDVAFVGGIDLSHGRRPSFTRAAPPEQATRLVDYFADRLRARAFVVATGRFGAMMDVELCNDGPVTIILDVERRPS